VPCSILPPVRRVAPSPRPPNLSLRRGTDDSERYDARMRVACLALLAFVAQDPKDAAKDWKHRWAGCGLGSWVKFEVAREVKTERTETVVRAGATAVEVEWREEGACAKTTWTSALPGEYTGRVVKAGEEEIKVGSRTFKCTIFDFKIESIGLVQTTRVWKCPDAPVWAVKQSWSQTVGDKTSLGWVEELQTVEEVVKVGEAELKCAVVARTIYAEGTRMIETEWRTPGIPGGVAKRTKRTFSGDDEVKDSASVEVAVAFEKK
jgi:hypothetical protein